MDEREPQSVADALAAGRAASALLRLEELEAFLAQLPALIGGWREVVCEIEDFGPNEALAKAMYATLDQMDKARTYLRDRAEASRDVGAVGEESADA